MKPLSSFTINEPRTGNGEESMGRMHNTVIS